MKKSLLVLAALAALSMAFVSCGGGDNGSTPTPEAETPTEVVVFDPAVLSAAPDGTEIVENDGVKYLKVTVDGYNTVVEVPEINLKGKTTFTTTVYADAANDGLKLTVKLADANNADIATPDITPLSTTPTVITATRFGLTSRYIISGTILVKMFGPTYRCCARNIGGRT